MSYEGEAVKRVFYGIVRKRGYEPSATVPGAVDRANVADLVNLILRQAWEGEWWPETMLLERRTYREEWDVATNYSDGDEVMVEDESGYGHYWQSLADNNVGNTPGAAPTWWTNIDDEVETSVSMDEAGETKIGRLDTSIHVFGLNPNIRDHAIPLRLVFLEGRTIVFKGVIPPAKWIRFQAAAPEFSWTDWSASTAYAIGDLVYLDSYSGTPVGETFKAIETSTNANPYTNTDKWVSVPFPKFLRDYVIHAVAGEDLREDEARYRERAFSERVLETLRERTMEAQGVSRRARR